MRNHTSTKNAFSKPKIKSVHFPNRITQLDHPRRTRAFNAKRLLTIAFFSVIVIGCGFLALRSHSMSTIGIWAALDEYEKILIRVTVTVGLTINIVRLLWNDTQTFTKHDKRRR